VVAGGWVQEARRGNVEAVRQLVEEHGASLDEEVVGETALHFASFYGHLPVVTYLLSRPECRLNKRNLGGTPSTRAAAAAAAWWVGWWWWRRRLQRLLNGMNGMEWLQATRR
jgi:ankyrin repeat protein